MWYFLLILLVIILCLGLLHGIYWLLTKGVIFVMASLFNILWYDKFWAVYLLILIIGFLFKGIFYYNHK